MTEKEIQRQTVALLDWLETRGMTENEAVAVLGCTITALVRSSPAAINMVCDTLKRVTAPH